MACHSYRKPSGRIQTDTGTGTHAHTDGQAGSRPAERSRRIRALWFSATRDPWGARGETNDRIDWARRMASQSRFPPASFLVIRLHPPPSRTKEAQKVVRFGVESTRLDEGGNPCLPASAACVRTHFSSARPAAQGSGSWQGPHAGRRLPEENGNRAARLGWAGVGLGWRKARRQARWALMRCEMPMG